MSLTCTGRALDAPAGITPTERLLLVHLARDAAGDAMVSTDIRHLAAGTNTNPFTVTRSLRRLAEPKLVQRGHFSNLTGKPSAKLIKKKLIASQRRLDPRTGEPITNLTRVNLELLAAMKRQRIDYDVIERITFDGNARLPTKKKAAKAAAQASDQVMAQDEPDLGPKMIPTSGQLEPDSAVKLSPGPSQVEPLTVSDPPEKPHGTVHPSVGSAESPEEEEETDGSKRS